MNKKQLFEKRREALQEIRFSNKSGSYVNHFRGSPNETDEHIDMKYQVWKQLRRWGFDCLVEPIFENNPGRADILDLDNHICYEIGKSETEVMAARKKGYYPAMFDIRFVDANKTFTEKMLQ